MDETNSGYSPDEDTRPHEPETPPATSSTAGSPGWAYAEAGQAGQPGQPGQPGEAGQPGEPGQPGSVWTSAGGADEPPAEQPTPFPHVESAGAPQDVENEAATTQAEAAESTGQTGHTETPAAEERSARPEEQSHEPRLRIDVELVTGDLVILGGASRVRVTTDGDEHGYPIVDQSAGYIRLADLPDDAELRVPDGCEIHVRHVDGDLRAERLDALLIVRGVGGDVELDRVAVADFESIDGDVSANRGGSLRVHTASGDVRVDDYSDAVLLGSIAGDVHFEHAGEVAIRDG